MASSLCSLRLLRHAVALPQTPRSVLGTLILQDDLSILNCCSIRSFSSRVPRLRRPPRLQTEEEEAIYFGSRPNAITLFPGDFTEDEEDPSDKDEDFQDDGDSQETEKLVAELRRREEEDKANRERWLRNSIPPVRVPQIDERGRAYGRGGRKRASARVWIQPGFGEVVVNRKDFIDYFERQWDREIVLLPLVVTGTCGMFDVQIMVQGGGLTGQAGAARHGLANALNHYNPDLYRPALKRLGLLTRDARKVERKKVGHVKARKSPQWVRR